MRIAIVTQYFPPDKPGRIADELSRALADRGHSVRVVTTYPHYDRVETAARLERDSTRGRVRVRRVPIYASHTRNPVARIANYLSFAWSATSAGRFVRDADVVYVHGTPATVAQPAHAWHRRHGIPYVFHVQDIWPESVTGSGFLPEPIANAAARGIDAWLGRVYRDAAAVLAIAPSARELLVERGADPDRVHLVYNWARDGSAGGEPPAQQAGMRLLYAGNLGPLQDLETVIGAVDRLGDLVDVRLEVAGAGIAEARLRRLVAERGLESRVRLLGRLAPEAMAETYARADFQIIPLKRLDIFASTIPSKVQAGLAHGVPAITTVAGDVSRIVEDHDLGFAAAPEDEEALALAMRAAYATTSGERATLRGNARAFYDAHFTLQHAVDRIESVLEAAAAERHGRGAARDEGAR